LALRLIGLDGGISAEVFGAIIKPVLDVAASRDEPIAGCLNDIASCVRF
jgi:hypothetical protein